jgi:hypothetical protein
VSRQWWVALTPVRCECNGKRRCSQLRRGSSHRMVCAACGETPARSELTTASSNGSTLLRNAGRHSVTGSDRVSARSATAAVAITVELNPTRRLAV